MIDYGRHDDGYSKKQADGVCGRGARRVRLNALDGNTAFVGAPDRGDLGANSGAAYIFDLSTQPSLADLNGADLATLLTNWG